MSRRCCSFGLEAADGADGADAGLDLDKQEAARIAGALTTINQARHDPKPHLRCIGAYLRPSTRTTEPHLRSIGVHPQPTELRGAAIGSRQARTLVAVYSRFVVRAQCA